MKKRGHGAVLYGTGGVGVKSALGEGDHVLVAEDLDASLGEVFAQQLDRGKREDEIADGPAAYDEDT